MLIRHGPMKEIIERDRMINAMNVALSEQMVMNGRLLLTLALLETGQTIYNCFLALQDSHYTNGNTKVIRN